MVARSKLRKEAYRYILQILGNLSTPDEKEKWTQFIPLEELRLIKEGVADPSPALVTLLKAMLGGTISEETFNVHLVKPFETYPPK